MVNAPLKPQSHLVVLGASNAALGLPHILAHARAMTGGPVHLFAAAGMGRSCGVDSRVGWRGLSGLRESGLFSAIERRSDMPAYGLVTDIGNDLLYERSPDQTLAWVLECVDRLLELGVRPAVTQLPIGNLATLSASRYVFFRSLFFPSGKTSLKTISARARDLNEKIFQEISDRQLPCVELDREWYGFDPIHFRPARATHAWRALLARCIDTRNDARGACWPIGLRIALIASKPEKRRVFWAHVRSRQPCRTLRDGSRVSLY